ncbi:hypothetical protein, partial [Sutterella wadsworthensis]|uniref:hypothetical protein n=1 Tax=Sutterella wadsworthensis TaxID=40545 RepID=UPI00308013A5
SAWPAIEPVISIVIAFLQFCSAPLSRMPIRSHYASADALMNCKAKRTERHIVELSAQSVLLSISDRRLKCTVRH